MSAILVVYVCFVCFQIFSYVFIQLSPAFHESVIINISFQNISTNASLTFRNESVNTARHGMRTTILFAILMKLSRITFVWKPWTYLISNSRACVLKEEPCLRPPLQQGRALSSRREWNSLYTSFHVCPHTCVTAPIPHQKRPWLPPFSAGRAQRRPRIPWAQSQQNIGKHIHKNIKRHMRPCKMCRSDIKTMIICIQQIRKTYQKEQPNIYCDD